MKLLRATFLTLSFLVGFVPAHAAPPPPVPALPDTSRITTYTPTASVGPFNLNFDVYGDGTDYGNWIEVWVNGVKKTAVTDWQLTSPSGALNLLPRPVTDARVTLTSAATGTVQIVGARRPRRVSQFDNGRGVAARDFNQALSDMMAVERETWDMRTRLLLAQPGQSLGYLPPAANCAGKFLGFDVTGAQPTCTTGGAGTGNVVGPAVSVIGHFPSYATTDGTLLADNAILPAVQFPALTGDVTTPAGSVSTTLASVITAAGPRGSATQTPVITYDAKGRLTAVTVATIAPPFSALTGSAACSQLPALTGSITSSAGTCSTAFAPNTIVDSMVNSAAGIDTSKIANTALGVGAVPMTQKVINNRFIYATGYGAVCDGVTDDAAALQRAFTVADAVAGTLVFPIGQCNSSTSLTLSGNSNVTIKGYSRGQSILMFTGATTGGIVFGSTSAGWTTTGNYSRLFFGAYDLNIQTNRLNLYNAITAFFPYIASSDLMNFQFQNINIQPANQSSGFTQGIYVYNGWRGDISNSSINGPIAGTPVTGIYGINLDGLSPAVQINHVIASYWDRAVNVGKVSFRAFSGTVSGTFQYAELVNGNTSGCQGRVARSPDAYGGAAIVTIPVTGTACTNGEIVTGATSGATISSITQPSVVQGNEGIYVNNSELILNNYAFYSNQPSGAATPAIGMWVQNSNLVASIAGIYGRYTGQWMISGNLFYNTANGTTDIDLDLGDIATITGNQINAGAFTTTTGIKLGSGGFTRAHITSNHIEQRTVGINMGAAALTAYPSGNQFYNNGTNITAASASFNGPAAFTAYNSASQTGIASATATKLTGLTTESYDIGSFYDAPNSKWTPPVGRVTISGCATFTAGIAAGATVALQLWKNGAYFKSIGTASAPTNLITGACGSTTDVANGTDYYELYVYADGAGTKTVINGPISTYFSGG